MPRTFEVRGTLIERLKRHFPAVPVKVILIDVDESKEYGEHSDG